MEAKQNFVLLEAVDEQVEERRVCGLPFSSHLVQSSQEMTSGTRRRRESTNMGADCTRGRTGRP
jgi:hypothetical protein